MTYIRSAVLNAQQYHVTKITCLAFSPTGSCLATGDRSGTTIIWDAKTGDMLRQLMDAPSPRELTEVDSLLWDPSRIRALFIGRADGRGEMFSDVLDERRIVRINTGYFGHMTSLDYDPKSRSLAVVAGTVVLVCRPIGASGDFIPSAVFPQPRALPSTQSLVARPRNIRINRGGTLIYATYLEHGIVCWDVAEETSRWQMSTQSNAILHSFFFKDFRSVFVAVLGGQACIYRVNQLSPSLSIQLPENEAIAPHWTAVVLGGRALATGAMDTPVRVWSFDADLVQEIPLESAAEHFTGVHSTWNVGNACNLACVVNEGAGDGFNQQRVAIYTAPIERSFRTIIAEFAVEFYTLHLHESFENLGKLAQRNMLWTSLFVLFIAVTVAMCHPEVHGAVRPFVSEQVFTIKQFVSDMLACSVLRATAALDISYSSSIKIYHHTLAISGLAMRYCAERLETLANNASAP